MNPRSALVPVVAAAVALVAITGGSSPAAHPDPRQGGLDLLSSAHPTAATPRIVDRAYDARGWIRVPDVSADSAAVTSVTCDGCAGESTTLQVVYAHRATRARLDNVATAWSQECEACTGTALSVQVVVLRGRPATMPNNRAIALNAACAGCRTSALAFQVVLVADSAEPLGSGELADLRAWVDEQAALLRASVLAPLPEPPTPTPSPTPTVEPTETLTPTPEPTKPVPTTDPGIAPPDPTGTSPRRARRQATNALAELEGLLTRALDADTVASDVEVAR